MRSGSSADDARPARRELLVSGEVFDRRAGSLFDSLVSADVGDAAAAEEREELFALLRELVATGLTARQREIVDLFYRDGLSQGEIAARLGITQQVVSKQLFGVVRDGRRIGGAIRRLRQLCEEHGIDPEQWV
jgi:RNA polymerase sigma factor (sigma-70 family)